jgi:hypothetical protein
LAAIIAWEAVGCLALSILKLPGSALPIGLDCFAQSTIENKQGIVYPVSPKFTSNFNSEDLLLS